MKNVQQPADAISSALSSHFRDVAATAGLRINDGQLSAVWRQGLLAAASGTHEQAGKDGARAVGLIHISTPGDRPLRTADKKDVPPGNYVVYLGADGSATITQVGGGASIIAKTSTGSPIRECTAPMGYRIWVQFIDCKICFEVMCDGRWIDHLFCLEIPFCKLLQGILT